MADAGASSAHELRYLNIVLAVDTSGSTAGATLEAELQAIRDISAFMNSPTGEGDSLMVLPWNHDTYSPIPLPKSDAALSYLRSEGGTTPTCMYENPTYLEAPRSSKIWILMTDGQISHPDMQDFATKTTELSLHGIPSIVIVFGYATSLTPGSIDTSVGLAIYARSPDSLFLFHDIATNSVFIVQCKGSFNCLLKGNEQPQITEGATWRDLPKLRYHDLGEVKVLPPNKLSPDELALQDGLVIRLKDFFAGKASAAVVERITSNHENLISVIQAEMSSNRALDSRLTEWLEKQQMPISQIPQPVLGKDSVASTILLGLLMRMDAGETDAQLLDDRTALCRNHDAHWNKYIESLDQYTKNVATAKRTNSAVRTASGQAYRIQSSTRRQRASGRTVSAAASDYMTPVIHIESPSSSDSDAKRPNKRSKKTKNVTSQATSSSPTGTQRSESAGCFIPGFTVNSSGIFEGKCSICHRASVLCFILKVRDILVAPNKAAISQFLSAINLDDILYKRVCCDACASYIVEPGSKLISEPVSGAVALVSMKDNMDAWVKKIE